MSERCDYIDANGTCARCRRLPSASVHAEPTALDMAREFIAAYELSAAAERDELAQLPLTLARAVIAQNEELVKLRKERADWEYLVRHEHAAECVVLLRPRDSANGLELLECDCGYNIAKPLKLQIDELRAALKEACDGWEREVDFPPLDRLAELRRLT